MNLTQTEQGRKTLGRSTAGRPVLLAVSFGTCYRSGRETAIGAIESELQAAYPEYEVRRAFTSGMILHKLRKRDGIRIDSVAEAMERMAKDGTDSVVVQSLHVTPGFEYDKMVREVSRYAGHFARFSVGDPLLRSGEDYAALTAVLEMTSKTYQSKDTAVIWMGHGTAHKANAAYLKMQETMAARGLTNHFVATVEAEPNLDDVIGRMKEAGLSRAVLLPMMIVAGDHACRDMAGDAPDSWKNRLEAEGFAVQTVLTGMGQYPGVREMIVRHAGEAIQELKDKRG